MYTDKNKKGFYFYKLLTLFEPVTFLLKKKNPKGISSRKSNGTLDKLNICFKLNIKNYY